MGVTRMRVPVFLSRLVAFVAVAVALMLTHAASQASATPAQFPAGTFLFKFGSDTTSDGKLLILE